MKIKRAFRIVEKADNFVQIQTIEDLLKAEGYEFKTDNFFPLARRCTHEPKALGSSLAHYFGLIYIQDRASMLPPIALAPKNDALILDMCASPGSKTSMLSTMLCNEGMVIGNEPNPTRLSNLRRNLELMQCFNTITCNYSGENIPLHDKSFDSILLDPPCSGWGTIDKNPNVREIWTEDKAKNLVILQRKLLKEASRLLKIGGEIVYSTCTTNIQENEEQVKFACEELGFELAKLLPLEAFEMDKPLNDIENVWRLEVKHQDTQGFFVAKFIKKEDIIQERSIESYEKEINFEELGIKELDTFQGKATAFGKNIYFIHEKAKKLSQMNKNFKFQGLNIGKSSGLHTQVSPKLRIYEKENAIIFDTKKDLELIYGLINGQSISYDKKASTVPFYWKDLYLGNLSKKGNRLLWVTK